MSIIPFHEYYLNLRVHVDINVRKLDMYIYMMSFMLKYILRI